MRLAPVPMYFAGNAAEAIAMAADSGCCPIKRRLASPAQGSRCPTLEQERALDAQRERALLHRLSAFWPDAEFRWVPEHRSEILLYVWDRDDRRCGVCGGVPVPWSAFRTSQGLGESASSRAANAVACCVT